MSGDEKKGKIIEDDFVPMNERSDEDRARIVDESEEKIRDLINKVIESKDPEGDIRIAWSTMEEAHGTKIPEIPFYAGKTIPRPMEAKIIAVSQEDLRD